MREVVKYLPDFDTCMEIDFHDKEECEKYEKEYAPFYQLRDEIEDFNEKLHPANTDYLKEALEFLDRFLDIYLERFKDYSFFVKHQDKLDYAKSMAIKGNGTLWDEVLNLSDYDGMYYSPKYCVLGEILNDIVDVAYGVEN